jgi:hypothetical protein
VSRKVFRRLDDFELLAESGGGRPARRGQGWKVPIGILAFTVVCALGALLAAFLISRLQAPTPPETQAARDQVR